MPLASSLIFSLAEITRTPFFFSLALLMALAVLWAVLLALWRKHFYNLVCMQGICCFILQRLYTPSKVPLPPVKAFPFADCAVWHARFFCKLFCGDIPPPCKEKVFRRVPARVPRSAQNCRPLRLIPCFAPCIQRGRRKKADRIFSGPLSQYKYTTSKTDKTDRIKIFQKILLPLCGLRPRSDNRIRSSQPRSIASL